VEARPWWESRIFIAALVLLATVPLLYPRVPPLVDLPGHMGRYRVQLDHATSPWLQHYFGFDWSPVGNLGVDVLLVPLAPLFGLELAVKLVVLATPPLTVAGLLWVAKEVHHRLPPTAVFALPFAFSHPFMFGFANYTLSMALALLAFALWLRLEAAGRYRLRALLFVPISFVIFFTHTFGWGMLGLLCFSGEAVRQHDRGRSWFRAIFHAGLQALLLALPILVMVAWRSDTHGDMARYWFQWRAKAGWIGSALRDRWRAFDIWSIGVVGVVIAAAVFSRRLTFSRNLLFSTLVLALGFVLMPRTVFSSAYADMRMVPCVLAFAVLAIRPRKLLPVQLASAIAIVGVSFFLLRIAGHTASLAIAANDQRAKLQALDHVPMGARVASLVGNQDCSNAWALPRNSHLPSMVIVRRHGFSNDQWVIEGMNLLQLRYTAAGPFRADSSQLVRDNRCRVGRSWHIDTALKAFPRDRFDYLWMIDVPPFDRALVNGMTPVWSGAGTTLYRIQPSS